MPAKPPRLLSSVRPRSGNQASPLPRRLRPCKRDRCCTNLRTPGSAGSYPRKSHCICCTWRSWPARLKCQGCTPHVTPRKVQTVPVAIGLDARLHALCQQAPDLVTVREKPIRNRLQVRNQWVNVRIENLPIGACARDLGLQHQENNKILKLNRSPCE